MGVILYELVIDAMPKAVTAASTRIRRVTQLLADSAMGMDSNAEVAISFTEQRRLPRQETSKALCGEGSNIGDLKLQTGCFKIASRIWMTVRLNDRVAAAFQYLGDPLRTTNVSC